MTFLEYMSFYPAYLHQFYAARPGLAQAPYAAQIDALIADGFSGVHVFAPAMAAHGFRPHFAVVNAAAAQAAWARENGLPADADAATVVRAQIDTIQPDVLYIADPTALDPRILRQCAWRPKLVIAWRAAPIPARADWRDVDLFVSSHAGCRAQAPSLGAKAAAVFRPGFPDHVARRLAGTDKAYDVVFIGQVGPLHTRRTAAIRALAAAPEAQDGRWRLGLFLANPPAATPEEARPFARPPLWGMDMYRALAQARIALNVHIDMAGGEAQNMRVFEATGCGAFLLTDHGDTIGGLFEPGRELDSFADDADMLAKIRHHLAHADEREAIARAGQARCLAAHGLEARAAELAQLIADHLPRRQADAAACAAHLAAAEAAPEDTAAIEAAPRRWPASADAWRLLGGLRRRQGRTGEALAALAQAAALAPRDLTVTGLLAQTLLDAGQPDQARAVLVAAEPWHPGNASLVAAIADRALAAGDAEAALAGYRRLATGGCDSALVRLKAGEALLALGQKDAARAEYAAALAHDPGQAQAAARLAQLDTSSDATRSAEPA